MNTPEKNRFSRRSIWLTAAIVVLVLLAALAAFRLVSGRSLGLRSFLGNLLSPLTNPVRNVLNGDDVAENSQGDYTNIIFLHHSTGRNLIDQGGLREQFSARGYDFWDHDYNPIGLRNPAGEFAGYNYNVPDDNTDPDGLAVIFSQPVRNLPVNTLSALLQHEVIMLKSCFPVSDIQSETQLADVQAYYLQMRQTFSQHPDKLFVLFTQPPLNPAQTDSQAAARARQLANWLASSDYQAGLSNLVVFDFFDQLAESDPAASDFNMLRSAYRDGDDSHPNPLANQTIAPVVVDFVVAAIERFRSEMQ